MSPAGRRLRLAAISALLVLSTATSCGDDGHRAVNGPKHGPLYGLNRALRIGVKTDQPGIGLADSTGTNNMGLDIDIANEIAKALHDRPVFQSVISRNREDMITTGAVDLVIASYSITEARLAKIAFAGPYLTAGQDIMVRSADKAHYTGPESLRDKRVCLLSNTTPYDHLKARFSAAWAATHLVTAIDGKPIGGWRQCVDLVLAGRVDAISTEDAVLAGYANEPDLKGRLFVVGKRFSREKYGIGLSKGDNADAALINQTLREMIRSGRWAAIVRKNLGVAAPAFLRPENVPVPPTIPLG